MNNLDIYLCFMYFCQSTLFSAINFNENFTKLLLGETMISLPFIKGGHAATWHGGSGISRETTSSSDTHVLKPRTQTQ